MMRAQILGLAVVAAVAGVAPAMAQQQPMSFFITSVGLGQGANLGGLAGADAHCQRLAEAAGVRGRVWRAYLSTQGAGAVNARDRIGTGPWYNAKGELIARSVAELHGNSHIGKETALTERGAIVPGRGDQPNQHDILTGSTDQGMAFPAGEDRTCSNWTSSTTGAAMTGHHDRVGLSDTPAARSWNMSHPTRGPDGGCSQADLRSTGGAGLFYCFAAR